jgi:predicted metal-dependent hydrolase
MKGVSAVPVHTTIMLGNTVIPYTVEVRPKRRYAAIQVTTEGQVRLLVPPEYSESQGQNLLREKSAWLLKHYAQRAVHNVKQFITGETFDLMNLSLTLHVHDQPASLPTSFKKRGDGDLVYHCSAEAGRSPEAVRAQLIRWYYRQAEVYIPARINHLVGNVGRRPTGIKIHDYKTRWGYCREDGLVAINWRIMQAPAEAIDYVIVHELVHLRFPHHQPTFWEGVSSVFPDYLVQKQWLKIHGAELQW